MIEQDILAKYSTAGLRRHELSRAAKKDHLASLKVVGEEAEKILTQLYPTKETQPCQTSSSPSPALRVEALSQAKCIAERVAIAASEVAKHAKAAHSSTLKPTRKKDAGLRAAIAKAGGLQKLGQLLGINYQAIQQWQRVPSERIVEIERVTGVRREALRPDLYREPVR
jgi:hypothetical protein